MELTKRDFKTLLNYTNNTDTEMSMESIGNLQSNGLIDHSGALTDAGQKALSRLQERMVQLEQGVPFEQRKINEPDLLPTKARWYSGTYRKFKYFTNFLFWTYAQPLKTMKITPGTPNIRSAVSTQMDKLKHFRGHEITPVNWFVWGDFDYDMIEFHYEGRSLMIDAVYYDFIKHRYQSPKFMVQIGSPDRIIVTVTKRPHFHGIVAVIGISVEGELNV